MTPSIFEQTGWKGSTGVEICQDISVLHRVTQYDYNFKDQGFRDYCELRGIMHRVLDVEFCADYTLSEEEYYRRDHPAVDKDPNGVPYTKVYIFSFKELQYFWRMNVTARGALQDCWEIFTFRR